jgi:arylsulfatase A-like enzyme
MAPPTALRVALALALVSAPIGAAKSPPPHLVFIQADDLGWHSVGFRERSLLTPALDDLRAHGVELSSYYTYKFCSPTRAALLTGRYPFKTESSRNNLIPFSQLDGVNANFTMLPAKLKAAGYRTHGCGKWHLGFWQRRFTPEARGFDSFDGFLAGGQDHFTQESFGECGCAARDVWINGSASAAPGIKGTYNAFRFTQRAEAVIAAHDPAAAPLFLYVALQNTHAPIQADASFAALYPNETYATRRDFSGMLSAVDSAVANITAALKAAGMWDNTVLFWASDNGSPGEVGGSAGARDNDLDATLPGRCCILSHKGRCSMGADHFTFMWDIEFFQCFMRMTHRFPIRCTTHDDANPRCRFHTVILSLQEVATFSCKGFTRPGKIGKMYAPH